VTVSTLRVIAVQIRVMGARLSVQGAHVSLAVTRVVLATIKKRATQGVAGSIGAETEPATVRIAGMATINAPRVEAAVFPSRKMILGALEFALAQG